jgi:hypothetical protein
MASHMSNMVMLCHVTDFEAMRDASVEVSYGRMTTALIEKASMALTSFFHKHR